MGTRFLFIYIVYVLSLMLTYPVTHLSPFIVRRVRTVLN